LRRDKKGWESDTLDSAWVKFDFIDLIEMGLSWRTLQCWSLDQSRSRLENAVPMVDVFVDSQGQGTKAEP